MCTRLFSKPEYADSTFFKTGNVDFKRSKERIGGSLLPCANCESFTGSGGANYEVRQIYLDFVYQKTSKHNKQTKEAKTR